MVVEVKNKEENITYLTEQLITYIGNKRKLIGSINSIVLSIKSKLSKEHLTTVDLFSGSGVVARLFKSHSSLVISNDIEDYSRVINECYLTNINTVNLNLLSEIVSEFNRRVLDKDAESNMGFIEELYAPADESNITKDDRVFYTKSNAQRLDRYRQLIEQVPNTYLKSLLLGPLLHKASVHANNAGLFKSFYKNRHTGIGQFGGTGHDALTRIKGEINLEIPVLSNYECEYKVYQEDANKLINYLEPVDLAYIDTPYNQHPYGSNYFMLNLLVNYQRPNKISKVSGIPVDWNRSGYNVKSKSLSLMQELLENVNAKYVLVSFSDDGFINSNQMLTMMHKLGKVEVHDVNYHTFRACRNLHNRSKHITEQLFLLEKS